MPQWSRRSRPTDVTGWGQLWGAETSLFAVLKAVKAGVILRGIRPHIRVTFIAEANAPAAQRSDENEPVTPPVESQKNHYHTTLYYNAGPCASAIGFVVELGQYIEISVIYRQYRYIDIVSVTVSVSTNIWVICQLLSKRSFRSKCSGCPLVLSSALSVSDQSGCPRATNCSKEVNDCMTPASSAVPD